MKDIIICDLDGTLADASHRLHHINPPRVMCGACNGSGGDHFNRCTVCGGHGYFQKDKDWDAFFEACDKDTLLWQTALVVEGLLDRLATSHCSPELWIVSGRSDAVRDKTVEWLGQRNVEHTKLIMRSAGDHTPDYQLKRKWLLDGTISKERVFCVFEDRSSVVEMWRTEGLTCYQVADGDF